MWEPLKRALLVVVHVTTHWLIAAFLLLTIKLLEYLMSYLWSGTTPTLFGVVPLIYIFHFMDFAILLVFGLSAITASYRVLRGDER